MRKFIQITGTRPLETPWFSRYCDVLAGEIDHMATHAQPASICYGEGFNRATSTLFILLLAYSNGLAHHTDPVYESMT